MEEMIFGMSFERTPFRLEKAWVYATWEMRRKSILKSPMPPGLLFLVRGMKECRELLRRCQGIGLPLAIIKNPPLKQETLKSIQVTAQHSPVDKLMKMASPTVI